MSGHTPGPWRVGDAGHTVFGPPNGNPSPETIAHVAKRNARLIAAAPELLEACRLAIPELEEWSNSDDFEDVHDDPDEDYSKALRAIVAAIAKATGTA